MQKYKAHQTGTNVISTTIMTTFGSFQNIKSKFCRYLSDGGSSLKKASNMLKTRYEELLNAMDMVGFEDEVFLFLV